MATLKPTFERRQFLAAPLRPVSWGAILAGAAMAVAIMVLLNMLGLAVGATVIEPGSADSPSRQALGIGAGIWWTVSAIVAFFVGGYVSARLAGFRRDWEGPIHGLVTWAVTTAVLVLITRSAAGALTWGSLHNLTGADGSAADRAADALAVAAWWSFAFLLLGAGASAAGGNAGARRSRSPEPRLDRGDVPVTSGP